MRISISRVMGAGVLAMAACKPSQILDVPPPAGVVASSNFENQAGAELAFSGAKVQLFQAIGNGSAGLIGVSGLLSDEYNLRNFSYQRFLSADTRMVTDEQFGEAADYQWTGLLTARSSLLVSIPGLLAYEPSSSQSKVGEAYALIGYSEIILAEDYCDGTPLDQVLPAGGVSYGDPLSHDSLLGRAIVHFDSALAHANGDASVTGLATVGNARALLDLGQYANAAAQLGNVPTSFAYQMDFTPTAFDPPNDPSLYSSAMGFKYYRYFAVSDREGNHGLNFISAADPRLVIDSSLKDDYGSTWYMPAKFEANLSAIPLATGIEARLIEAEAALQNNQAATWAADLSALRADSADTHVTFGASQVPIQVDSTTGVTDSAQIDFMFRERAFWLFGTGTRLGDLRRLVRSYGRVADSTYPSGAYSAGPNQATYLEYFANPVFTYGHDVVFSLPTSASNMTITNPKYKGCLTPTTSA